MPSNIQNIEVTFQEDHKSFIDDIVYRIVQYEGKDISYKKFSGTSWPKPKKNQKIKCQIIKYRTDGTPIIREVPENYWSVDEFSIGQRLDLEFVNDYSSNNGRRHRVAIDSKGRKYDYLFTNSSVENPTEGQKIICEVTSLKEDGYPFVTEIFTKKVLGFENYKEGQVHELEVVQEFEKDLGEQNFKGYRQVRDSYGNLFVVSRHPSQIGKDYQSQEGKKIAYKIFKIENEKIFWWEDNVKAKDSLSSIEISQFDNDTQIFIEKHKKTFLEDVINQYIEEDRYWIWSLINTLHKESKNNISKGNLNTARDIFLNLNKICSFTIDSDFIAQYPEPTRSNHKSRLEKESKKSKLSYQIINQFLDIGNTKYIKNILALSNNKDSDLEKIYLSISLLNFELSNQEFEKVCNFLIDKFSMNDLTFLSYLLKVRKKHVRENAFGEENFFEKRSKFDRESLKHLLFIEELHKKFFDFSNILPFSMLCESNIFRFKGMLSTDKSLILKSIDVLNTKIKLRDYLKEPEDISTFSKSVNWSKFKSYQYLASISKDTSETIQYLREVVDYSSRIRSKASYIFSGYLKIYEIIEALENYSSDTHQESIRNQLSNIYDISIREQIASLAEDSYVTFTEHANKGYLSQILGFNEIRDAFNIIRLISKDTSLNRQILLDYANSKEGEVMKIKTLASFVLADLLMKEFSDFDMLHKLNEVLTQGSINLKEMINETPDEDAVEDKSELDFIEKVNKDEGHKLEFKASYEFDIDALVLGGKSKFNNKLKYEVIKSIAGMLNSNDGGSIFIGILEMRPKYRFDNIVENIFKNFQSTDLGKVMVLGLEKEIEAYNSTFNKKFDIDEYCRYIQTAAQNILGESVLSRIRFHYHYFKNRTVVEIEVFDNELRDGWIANEEGIEILYVRENNQTNSFTGFKNINEKLSDLKDILINKFVDGT